jgi:hypothetical protein
LVWLLADTCHETTRLRLLRASGWWLVLLALPLPVVAALLVVVALPRLAAFHR